MSEPVYAYQVFIAATPERVWNAIVDDDVTAQYFYGTRVDSTWEAGAEVIYSLPDGRRASKGEVISIDPGKQVEMTFLPLWDPDLTAEGPAREVWSVEDVGGATKLTVEVFDIAEGGKVHTDFATGFPYIISGLKTVVETGKPLQAAGPRGT